MSRRPRAPSARFDVEAMTERLRKSARLRDNAFDWELSEYSKTRRSRGPGRDGLIRCAPLLDAVLDFTPGCYPNHVLLRSVWMQLHQDKSFTQTDEACACFLKLLLWLLLPQQQQQQPRCAAAKTAAEATFVATGNCQGNNTYFV